METDDPRPTYQWPTWQKALLALHNAGKGIKPRLARSSLWATPGARPPEIEDFTRLRTALAAHDVVGDTLVQLTALARQRREFDEDIRPHRLRLVRALRREKIIPESLRIRTSTTRVVVPGEGETTLRTTYVA
jgi:hypothetical protein